METTQTRKSWMTGIISLTLFLLSVCTSAAWAKVTVEEAKRLNMDLTPLGAERAGNAEGTIPTWDGGIRAVPEGLNYDGEGSIRPDPFADDQIRFTISADNVDQYTDHLSAGTIALIKRYPDTFKVHVYPTRRSAAYPQWIYENTSKNAVACEVTPDGLGILSNGGSKGTPFPIPQSAEEVMWNHLLNYWGGSFDGNVDFSVVQSDGSRSLTTLKWYWQSPWYDKENPNSEFSRMNAISIASTVSPAKLKGSVTLVWDPLNQSEEARSAWSYLPGQRRVRRAPTVAYDSPNTVASAIVNQDDVMVFNGALDRYDWRLVGKKEIFIPYNNYKVVSASQNELLTPKHHNPEVIRWELHRVWVVEAILKQGKRHAVARRTLYVDEDSWAGSMSDSYDGHDKLWRAYFLTRIQAYEIPTPTPAAQFAYDFQRADYAGLYMTSGMEKQPVLGKFAPDNYFTPNYVRVLGTR